MTKDGTQDPGPPPVLTDPVSGLVTGSRYEPEPLKVRVVEPPMPDISAVREAMVGMLDDDSELSLGLAAQRAAGNVSGEIPVRSTAEPSPTPPIGIPAQQTSSPAEPPPEAPAAPAPETPPAGGQVRRIPPAPTNARVITPGTVERTRRLPSRIRRIPRIPRIGRARPRPEKPAAAMGRKSSTPSLTIIAVLLLVTAVIVVVLIASLVDTISSIFG